MAAAVHQNSSDFSPMSSADLSTVQLEVAAALAQGNSVTEAARRAGIHRTTIHQWLRSEPAFKSAYQTARREFTAVLKDELRDLASRAVQTLRSLLDDPNTPAAVRLRTALAVLNRPQDLEHGWSLPANVDAPQRQAIRDEAAEIRSLERWITEVPGRADESSSPVARCAPCPCGSGRKFKRCCAVAPGLAAKAGAQAAS